MQDIVLDVVSVCVSALAMLVGGCYMGSLLARLIFRPKQWVDAVEVKKNFKWKEPAGGDRG